MKKLFVFIFWIFCVVISALINGLGVGMNTWQWWIGCGCVWFSYACGYMVKEYEVKKHDSNK